MKGDSKPVVHLQVFDTEDFPEFMRFWKPYLNKNDGFLIEKHIDLVGWHHGNKTPRKKMCRQPWEMIIVDVDGYVYPCCEGVWIPHNEELCLGHITDSKTNLIEKHEKFKKKFKNNEFLNIIVCENCPA
jgi:radical SAM protein with 4Fe4S-binding SPASM domain